MDAQAILVREVLLRYSLKLVGRICIGIDLKM